MSFSQLTADLLVFSTESSFCQLDSQYVVKQSIERAVFLFLTALFSFLLKLNMALYLA